MKQVLEISNLNKILIFILTLIPLALVTSSFLLNLFALLVILLFLAIYFQNRLELSFLFRNKYTNYLFLFLTYLIINSLLSENYLYSLKKSVPYFGILFFTLAVWYASIYIKNFHKYFLNSLILALSLVCLHGYFEYFFKINIFLQPANPYRLSMLISGEWNVGSFIARTIPLVFALIFYNYDNKKNIPYYFFILIIFLEILVYLSGERTSIFILFITNLTFILLCSKWKLIRVIMLTIVITSSLFFTYYDNNVKERIVDHTYSQMSLKEGRVKVFSDIHENYYLTSLNLFTDKPLLGHGVNSYRKVCSNEKYISQGSCSTHPHNIYLQLLAETGIIGFLFLSIFYFYIVQQLFNQFLSVVKLRKKFLSDYQICLFSCYISVLFPIMPSNNFFNSWITLMYFLPLGFLLSTIIKK